jgi:hypothetical protein
MLVARQGSRNSLASAVAGIIFDLPVHCEFREVMSADCSLPKSVSQRRLALLAFRFFAQQLEDY